MRQLVWAALVGASVIAACSDFADLPRDVCGNGLLEAGEDCDSDDPSCVRCAVTCIAATDCPTSDYACGVDGLCHAPGGRLADPTPPQTFPSDELRVSDLDRDGFGDVIGVATTSIAVRDGDPAGSLVTATSFVTPAQSGPPAFGDLDGDRAADVALTTVDGIVHYTSRFGALAPVAIESPLFDDQGQPLDLRSMFAVGSFQLGALIDQAGAMILVVIDLVPPQAIYATAPCVTRLGVIGPDELVQSSLDIYRASGENAVNAELVVSFITTSGAPCVTSIHGSQAAGFAFDDLTPTGAQPVTQRPVLADLDLDADPCPSLVNSSGGGQGLRAWEGHLASGHCTLDAAGPAGAVLGPVENAPPSAVAIGRIALDPPILGVASDAVVLTSGVYGFVPSAGGFGEIYDAGGRELAHVATGDLDRDGDLDAVLASEAQDDLDVLYRFPLGLQLLRLDTAAPVSSLTLGDFDGNLFQDIAYTEPATDHQELEIAYGTADRPLDPVRVAAFSGVSSVSKIQFPDSVDRLSICDDLAVIHLDDAGGLPTLSLLHGSPQRTMLSFLDPRLDDDRGPTLLRGAVIGNFIDQPAGRSDVIAVGSLRQDDDVSILAWGVPGTPRGLDPTPSEGTVADGLADCDGTGVCVGNAAYLAWPVADGADVVIAIDRDRPRHAAVLDPRAAGAPPGDATPVIAGLPDDVDVRSLHAVDVDGDGARELLASFARPDATGGSVRLCATTAGGVPTGCEELAPVVAAIDPTVAGCVDAAPGRVAPRGPAVEPRAATDLVVLCTLAEGSSALYRVSTETGALAATPLARGVGLRALAVADVTGDGVDDVVAVQGVGGTRAVTVFAQCSSRDLAGCRGVAAGAQP